jgi:hypothetical protein
MPDRRGQGESVSRVHPWSLPAFLAVCAAVIVLGGWLRAVYAPEWIPQKTSQPPRPWAVEADCYSQLARDQRILQGQGLIQNHFTVENWPEGLIPSTTAPFDYAILTLYAPLTLVTPYPLDWAGALISPALGLALVFFWMFFRSRTFNRAGRAALIIGLAFIPALIWATSFGRPRHQSLIVALLAVALTAEYERWDSLKKHWHIAAGILWGFACWTSLFEPLLAVVTLVIFNLVVRRRESAAFGISFGVVMLVALVLEGVHVFIPPPEYRDVLGRWLQFIAEMRGMTFGELANGMTLAVLVLPWISWQLWARGAGNKTDYLLIILTVVLAVLAFFEKRWLNYACLTEIFLFARYFQIAPLRWSRALLALLFLADVAQANYLEIENTVGQPPAQPSAELAQIARSIDAPGGIMAPWWISPGLLYFSGQPIVSGSSHCGISGIAASAAFFATTSWNDAEKILHDRQVRWVVVWDEKKYQYPLLASSQEILGLPVSTDDEKGDADDTVAQVLVTDHGVPTDFHLRAITPHLKLYEIDPAGD